MKKMFWIFVLVTAFLIPTKVSAVDLKLTYDNDFKKVVYDEFPFLPSYDDNGNIDGYLFFYEGSGRGFPGMIKLDLNNKIVYDKSDDEVYASDIDINSGNQSHGLLITRYDDNNKILFEREYGDSDESYLGCLNSFNDKGEHDGYLILTASTSSNLKVDPGYIVIKLDSNGDIVWEKNINEFVHVGDLAYIVNKKVDSGFGFDGSKVYRQRINEEEYAWEKDTEIDITDINYSYNETGVVDGIVVVGMDDKTKGVIIKYDLSGNEIFRHSYNNAKESVYTGVISSLYVDGKYDGYIVTGATADNDTSINTLIIKYDYSGKIVWTGKYSDSEILFFDIIRNYDNTGKPNGYLLYQKDINVSSDKRRLISFDNSFNGYKVKKLDSREKIKQYKVAKYTYENYQVKKDTTDEGEITVSNDKAYPGDIVKIKVTPKEGYVLKRIVVLDESGKEIEVSEDGTFIMPEGKVTVTAIYNRITNPETVSACYVVLGIILLISIGTLIVSKKKEA